MDEQERDLVEMISSTTEGFLCGALHDPEERNYEFDDNSH